VEPNRVFPVEPEHSTLPGGVGVQFNVETVSALSDKDSTQHQVVGASAMQLLAKAFYAAPSPDDHCTYGNDDPFKDLLPENEPVGPFNHKNTALLPGLEATSNTDGVTIDGSAFSVVVVRAFAEHRPLILKPDDLWSVICNGFSRHVSYNADALCGGQGRRSRDVVVSNFMKLGAKKELRLDADHLLLGGSPAHEWEAAIFPAFSRQIKEHVGPWVHEAIATPFSTSTPCDVAAAEATVMSTLKHYSSYMMDTFCGVPWVQLQGSLADWQLLRARTEALGALMVPDFAQWWLGALLPLLDEFVSSYEGNVNHRFWQNMVKVRRHGNGSGSHTAISGWLSILYPYLKDGGKDGRRTSPHVRPWQEMTQPGCGPRPEEFPMLLSSAPVRWEYFGCCLEMHFHSGPIGLRTDEATGALSVCSAWMLTHDIPTDPELKIERLKVHLDELHRAHAQPYQMQIIEKELACLERSLGRRGSNESMMSICSSVAASCCSSNLSNEM
jgi:hypothetical protein